MITVELYKNDEKIRSVYTSSVDIDHKRSIIYIRMLDSMSTPMICRFKSVRCNHVSNSDWHQIYVTLEDE